MDCFVLFTENTTEMNRRKAMMQFMLAAPYRRF
jgi:hypothetical protein